MLVLLFSLLLGSCVALTTFDGSVLYDVRGYRGLLTGKELNETCGPPLSGYEWVLSQRRQDYGWGDQTHRAVIVLALNDFGKLQRTDEETQLIEHQLEVELSRALLRNETQTMFLSDLALYIHALIITFRDPRNFYGLDLVEILKARLDTCSLQQRDDVNVFALLVLSDSRAIETKHLQMLRGVLHKQENNRKQKEMKAIALHALACATDGGEFQQYSTMVKDTATILAGTQNPDGSFGNLYTTALVMQALTAAQYKNWNEKDARNFLTGKRTENMNMVSTYYVEKALHAHKQKCLKDLYPVEEPTDEGFHSLHDIQRWPRTHYVQYSLRVGDYPDVYFTITMKVPSNATFFDIMRLSEAEDQKFRFSWHLDESDYPMIYSISGIPNNAEESLYWRLVVETEVDHDRHESKKTEFIGSPMLLTPEKDSHMIFWYIEAFKPIKEVY